MCVCLCVTEREKGEIRGRVYTYIFLYVFYTCIYIYIHKYNIQNVRKICKKLVNSGNLKENRAVDDSNFVFIAYHVFLMLLKFLTMLHILSGNL